MTQPHSQGSGTQWRFQKVLVPVDFSERSRDALLAAGDIARRGEGSVGILHVSQPIPFTPPEAYVIAPGEGRATLQEHLKNEAERRLSEMVAFAKEHGIEAYSLGAEYGRPATEILRIAKEGDYDLLVVATHGRKGLARAFMGSVAEELVRRAPCPVLCVKIHGSDDAVDQE